MKKQLAILAALAALTSFGAIRAVTPTVWDGDQNCWQMKRHAEKMAVVTNGGARVVLIGDSITHFWETNGRVMLRNHLSEGPFRTLNLGTSADRTEHVLWRLTAGKELDGYEAKVVFLMIGTNNTGHFPFEKEPPVDTILGIREIVKVIRAKQPKARLVLTAIFPRGLTANDPCRLRNAVVNAEIQKFADGKNVFWLDMTSAYTLTDGTLLRNLFPDLLHPNDIGYGVWFEGMRPYLDAFASGRGTPLELPEKPKRPAADDKPKDPVPARPVSRIRRDERGPFDWWLDRLLVKRNEIADSKGEFDLVFFGDSITHNWESFGKESLDELRKTYSVLNIGYGGDRTEHLLWRGENGELDGYKAKCVMLMVGTNNSGSGHGAQDIAAGIRKLLELIARKQPQAKVLLLPIFPCDSSPRSKDRVNNEQVNQIIRGFADGKKVIWVDFNSKFLDKKGDVRWIMPDGWHPTAAGYRDIWLPAVLPHFKAIVGK